MKCTYKAGYHSRQILSSKFWTPTKKSVPLTLLYKEQLSILVQEWRKNSHSRAEPSVSPAEEGSCLRRSSPPWCRPNLRGLMDKEDGHEVEMLYKVTTDVARTRTKNWTCALSIGHWTSTKGYGWGFFFVLHIHSKINYPPLKAKHMPRNNGWFQTKWVCTFLSQNKIRFCLMCNGQPANGPQLLSFFLKASEWHFRRTCVLKCTHLADTAAWPGCSRSPTALWPLRQS